VDPLSDVLRAVRLDGAFFFQVEAAEPWRVDAVAAHELSPRILPAAEHLISYHILTEGQCYANLVGQPPIEAAAGDVILFPHGDPYVMSSARSVRTEPFVHTTAPDRYPHTVVLGAGPPGTRFVCGFLGCDRRPFNPLLTALPRLMHVPRMSSPWLATLIEQVTAESRHGRAGADGVLTRLAELMFIEVLRRYVDLLPAEQIGWLAGLRDDVVRRVLGLLHGQPGQDWALESLAREAASSRSTVAKRFALLVGQPPMQYLAQWRMQVAASRLVETDAKVATIGAQVGYNSEAAFSRAFKRGTGVAPGAWRATRRKARD